MDYTFFLVILTLLVGGLLMVYSASAILAYERYDNSFHFIARQLVWALLGVTACILASRVDLERLRPYAFPLVLMAILLMGLVMVPGLGRSIRGAQRWIHLGPFSFQPSEALKLAMVFYLAESLARRRDQLVQFWDYKPYFILITVSLLLLMKQHDFGTMVLLSVVSFSLLFLSGMRWKHILVPVAVLLPFLAYLIQSVSYRMKRIMAFLDPWEDPLGTGFQLIQSLIAVGSGGPLGVGLSNSSQKLFYLPDPHTDFIFAILGEELGLWGTGMVLFLFTVLILRGFTMAWRVAERQQDAFLGLLAAGITGMIGLQAFVNLGVVIGLLPTKGIPLPLISYGGTSLLFTLIGVGLLLNISRRVKMDSPLDGISVPARGR